MKIIEAADVQRTLNFPDLIAALRATFAKPAGTPRRNVYHLDESDAFHDALGVLPAWNEAAIAVKVFTYLPSNVPHGRQVLNSKILLFSRTTGAPLAVIDGTTVTYWRTAAVAALAADYLAREDADRLLFCGTGKLAPYMILAHAAVRRYESVAIWGRTPEKVRATIAAVKDVRPELRCVAVANLELAARNADVISCATGAQQPLILGDWLRPGTHTDFFGNHERKHRECDTSLVAMSRVYVDSRANTLNEAGEILIPIEEGRITEAHIQGELADLCSGRVPGRRRRDEITLFKSVGTALSDLAAASLITQSVLST